MKHSFKINFSRQLNAINDSPRGDIYEWLICPGMDFNASVKWWGDQAARKTPHEGLDLVFFKNHFGKVIHLNEKYRIPALFDGEIIVCFNDFLGKTMVFCHEQYHENSRVLCSMYGHVNPIIKLTQQKNVSEGEPVAVIARVDRQGIYAHLHISLGWVSEKKIDQLTDWGKIVSPEVIRLIDPVNLVGNISKVNRSVLFPE